FHIGARARFRDRDRADKLAERHARKPAAFLRLAAVVEDVMRNTALDERGEVDARSSELLDDDRFVREGSSASAILRRNVAEQQTYCAGLRPRFGIGTLLLAPAVLLRCKLFFDETTGGCAEQPQLVIHPRRFINHDFLSLRQRQSQAWERRSPCSSRSTLLVCSRHEGSLPAHSERARRRMNPADD